jgi:A/G-specific adenine glycosylase
MSASPIPLADPSFAGRLVDWQMQHGRHELPWQRNRDPYAIWLSEIMLQQTQVSAVTPYYLRFLDRFPTLTALANSTEDDVLRLWSGLGYYSRARNLHRAAAQIVSLFSGAFPRSREAIETLPGIGRSTAAAISVFAFGGREAILDGNVKRVLARHFAVEGFPGERNVEKLLWKLAESLLPTEEIEAYTQGLMDLGATVCTRSNPACGACPLAVTCGARALDRIAELPTPKPRKPIPRRETVMLVLRDGDDTLLEKRASVGIWGGLWSFPEVESVDVVRSLCESRFGCVVLHAAALPKLRHGFTHFSLDIAPVLVQVRRSKTFAQESGSVWLSLEDARHAALPVPVKKILASL